MKLSKILFPEILLGRRGPKTLFPLLQKLMDSYHFTSDGIQVELGDNEHFNFLINNINGRAFWSLAKRFKEEKAKTYHVCRDFAEALINLKDREVNEEYLPKEFLGYISFPDNLIKDEQEEIDGAFVWTGLADNRTVFQKENWGKRFIWIAYAGKLQADGNFGTGRICFHPGPGLTLTEIIEICGNDRDVDSNGNTWHSEVNAKARIKIARLVVNALLYLNSQDPELLALRPAFGASHSYKKKVSQGGHINECTLPITAINWDYKKIFSTESRNIFYDSFLRWQRCGPKNSQIKLIWVKEHEKTRQILV